MVPALVDLSFLPPHPQAPSKTRLTELGREPAPEVFAESAGGQLGEAGHVVEKGRQPMCLDRPVGECEDANFSEFV